MNKVKRLAVRRVLRLVDGYLSTRDQSELIAYDGGMMTWGELRQHVKAALNIVPPARRVKQPHPKGK